MKKLLAIILILCLPLAASGVSLDGVTLDGTGINSCPQFRFTVTVAGADTFTLPIYDGGSYDFELDCGNGTNERVTAFDDAERICSYSGAGTYTITVIGTITGWRFADAGDKTLIKDIQSWGPLVLGNLNGYFSYNSYTCL